MDYSKPFSEGECEKKCLIQLANILFKIFTDGSKSSTGIGAAFVASNIFFKFELPNSTTI